MKVSFAQPVLMTSLVILLAESARDVTQIATPIHRQQSVFYVAVKGAVRPIRYPVDIAVFDWIEVDVIDMPLEVCIIADCVFPKSPLPDAFFPLHQFAR